ncbi:hypothetical protein KA001_01560 [Patescibacteria group bacterium]|nr:hypothetical protein [Patescibacteria group bacterium]
MDEATCSMQEFALAVDLIAPSITSPNKLIIVDFGGECFEVSPSLVIPESYGSGYGIAGGDLLDPYVSFYTDQIYTSVVWGLVVVLDSHREVTSCYYIYPNSPLCRDQVETGREKVLTGLEMAKAKAQNIINAKKMDFQKNVPTK